MHDVKILLAEGHAHLREALRSFLGASAGLEVVGEAIDGSEAISAAMAHAPDVALVDTGLPGTGAFVATRLVKEASPNTKVVIVADEDSEEYREAAWASGASAFVAKERVDRDLTAVIRSLLR